MLPEQALAWLVGRGQLTATFNWQDVWQDEHGQQFTISRLTRLDLLQFIYDTIVQSVEGDLSRTDWMRDVERALTDAGWWGTTSMTDPQTGDTAETTFNASRLRLIYDTNTRMAYSAGQWERIDTNKRTHPYVRYISKHDERVRASHLAWDGLVLPVDDDFWKTHWPPNGWRCRCRVVSLSKREYDRGYWEDRPGAETDVNAPIVRHAFNTVAPAVVTTEYVNPRTGEVQAVPVGIDPGFGYNAGQARRAALDRLQQDRVNRASGGLGRAAQDDGFTP